MYGATQEDWDRMLYIEGLQKDLLPVVCDPRVMAHPRSKIKVFGKTPSQILGSGRAVGIPSWSQLEPSDKDIALWRSNPSHGICIQTRTLRAIDVDVDDPDLAAEIEQKIIGIIGRHATRYREGSSRFLIAVYIADTELFYKQTATIYDKHAIEFLGNGQQFIAFGQHTSGIRYQWRNDEAGFQTIQPEQMRAIIDMAGAYGGLMRKAKGIPVKGENIKAKDYIADQLIERGLVLEHGKNGYLHIDCPFKEHHTTEGNISETSYMPKGTNTYNIGVFKCFHSHCAERTQAEFMDALGLQLVQFVDLSADLAQFPPAPTLMQFDRNKQGRPLATRPNIDLALSSPLCCGAVVTYDSFLQGMRIAEVKQNKQGEAYLAKSRDFHDNDYAKIMGNMEKDYRFQSIPAPVFKERARYHASVSRSDSAMEYVNSLVWDGKQRVERFLIDYLGVADNDYHRACAMYHFTAAAGRMMEEYVKADMCMIWIGAQGLRKTTAVQALAINETAFGEIDLNAPDADKVRVMRGKNICEISEMRGMYAHQMDMIKAFMTRAIDEWVPKYQEFTAKAPRRCMLIGTSNYTDLFNDPTGNRRFLPIEIKDFIDTNKIKRDMRQIYAEAAELYKANGVMCYQEAEILAKKIEHLYISKDPWESLLSDYCFFEKGGLMTPKKLFFHSDELMVNAIGISLTRATTGDYRRLSGAVQRLGFGRSQVGAGRKRGYEYLGSDGEISKIIHMHERPLV